MNKYVAMEEVSNHDWSRYAQKLCHLIPRNRLEWSAINFLKSSHSLGVGCSGGMDSVCLLLLIYGYFGQSNEVIVLHYNHNTRAEETDADELFVTNIAFSLGLRVFSEKRKKSNVNSEEALRRDRYGFFLNLMRSIGCNCLILGHHLDDMIESMLMRLAKGYGLKALASPFALQRFADHMRVRPMINIKRSFIEQSLKTAEIPWREDPSNHCDLYLRNRLRCCIRKDFDRLFRVRDWRNGFAMARQLMAEDSEALDQIASMVPVSVEAEELDLTELRSMPRAIIRRILITWLENNNLVNMARRKHLDAIMGYIINEDEKILSCTTAKTMVVKRDRIIITQVNEAETYDGFKFCHWVYGDLYLPSGVLRRRGVRLDSISELFTDDSSLVRLALRSDAELMVRSWLPGDAYVPFGLDGCKKLKKCFCERKIPVSMRKILPVVVDASGEILWVPGLPIGNGPRIKSNDMMALELTFFSR
ncbi:MAG: tRNA lysidine(34) synthetase TilS [Puniceicoccales bacterium]|nr:tRNA lysidine(34) synthetase TilS [Puniceicoccales bacterium]